MKLSKSSKRRRGVVLTSRGWQKLQQARVLESDWGDRYSFGQLSDRTELDRRTIAKIISRQQGVDRRTLQMFFEAFDLELVPTDYEQQDRSATDSEQFPDGPVPLNSRFYIERPPIETLAYEEINSLGSLIRIKAPRQMGKSSLLLRIIDRAAKIGYETVKVDFQQTDATILANCDRLLRWFCTNVARQLNLDPNLDDYWDEDIGNKVSCTIYFQEYILPQLKSPLFLAFNEVNLIFEHEKVARDFLPLLRFWYEQAKQDETFQKLSIALVHSTEIYVALNINQSPFNVGLALDLPPFNLEQILLLAELRGLDAIDFAAAKKIIAAIGGHPYLINRAFYFLSKTDVTLDNLLATAHTQNGIYINHLRSQFDSLQKEPQLASAFSEVVNSKDGVGLNPIVSYKLDSMGLVKIIGEKVTPSCKLYELYFSI